MIIGLSGKKLSGKDTTYKFIEEWSGRLNIPVRRDAFADRLKLSACRIFYPNVTLEEAINWANDVKESAKLSVRLPEDDLKTVTGREFLQNYGTEAHREVFGTDFWLRPVETAYLEDPDTMVVITDVRFDNEAKMIRDLGGVVWEVRRSEVDDGDGHASETPIAPRLIEYIIHNNQTLDHLKLRVDMQMQRLLG